LEQGILKLSALTYGGPGVIILGTSHSLSITLQLKNNQLKNVSHACRNDDNNSFIKVYSNKEKRPQKKFPLKDSFLSTIVRVQLFEFYKHEMRPMAKMTLLNEFIYPLDHVKCYHVTYNHQPTSQYLRSQKT
jgi:hypothetical protein